LIFYETLKVLSDKESRILMRLPCSERILFLNWRF
jgi:hypothetical protein